ncbi:MAG: hypothetical protein MJE66_16780 [Proteobacteria bacterium]|nr:hypothetical protein [Pseudomonadota bacterium]
MELSDASSAFVRLALEGPAVPEIMARAAPGLALPAPECACEWELEDHVVSVAAYGVSGMPTLQYLIPSGGGEAVRRVLSRAGEGLGLVEASPAALEVLRIEAGTPALGPELDEDVLPDEAGLGRAISDTKGCYTGQEIVARLRSQGQVAHRLVGLRFGADAPLPPVDSDVRVGGRVIGEVTSVCQSAQVGAIALGYVRRAHAESGTEVEVAGRPAQVSSLPFVAAKAAG